MLDGQLRSATEEVTVCFEKTTSKTSSSFSRCSDARLLHFLETGTSVVVIWEFL